MRPAGSILTALLPSILARAPLTPEKIAFAWRTAAGPAMERAGTVELVGTGTLLVRTADPNWAREIERESGLLLSRMQALLGDGVLHRIVVATNPTVTNPTVTGT